MFITKTRTAMEHQDKLYEQFKDAAHKEEKKILPAWRPYGTA
jgi:hypothetical protein